MSWPARSDHQDAQELLGGLSLGEEHEEMARGLTKARDILDRENLFEAREIDQDGFEQLIEKPRVVIMIP